MDKRVKSEIKLVNGSFYVNVEAAAQLCNVGKSTILAWRKQPKAPPYDDKLKMYNLHELGQWIRTEQIYKRGVGGVYKYKPDFTRFTVKGTNRPVDDPVTILPGVPEKPSIQLEDQDERVKRLRGDKLEMELQEKAGTLVNADDVLIAMSSMASRVKTRLMSLPTSLAPVVTGKEDRVEVQSIIDKGIRAALDELSGDYRKEIEAENEL